MGITCTLTIKDDRHAEYEDDRLHLRGDGDMVSGELGGARHVRATIKLLHEQVGGDKVPCTRNHLQILGCHLYDVAFGPEGSALRKAFEKTLRDFSPDDARERLRLRLVIEADATELSSFPWEFLFMPGDSGFFLAGQKTDLILTRYVPEPPIDPAVAEPDGELRILIVVSQPRSPSLNTVAAEQLIDDIVSLEDAPDLKIKVFQCKNPTRTELEAQVREHEPHVVHFVGHGQPGEIALQNAAEEIAFARASMEREMGRPPRDDEVDEADWADATSMRGFLHAGLEDPATPRRLFFLHSCQGASTTLSEHGLNSFRNLAQELATHRKVGAVLAMQYKISNTDAQSFARSFYEQMRAGCEVDEAVSIARRKLGSAPTGGNRQSWNDRGFGTPVIYLRDERPLFQPPAVPHDEPADRQQVEEDLPTKSPCPNPDCRGYVIRGRPPCRKRDCGEWFEECPDPNCSGLVVPRPGYFCTGRPDHEYVAAGGKPTGRVTAAAAAQASGRAGSPGAPDPPNAFGQAAFRQLGVPSEPPEHDGNGRP
jgi:hypothetical protein